MLCRHLTHIISVRNIGFTWYIRSDIANAYLARILVGIGMTECLLVSLLKTLSACRIVTEPSVTSWMSRFGAELTCHGWPRHVWVWSPPGVTAGRVVNGRTWLWHIGQRKNSVSAHRRTWIGYPLEILCSHLTHLIKKNVCSARVQSWDY